MAYLEWRLSQNSVIGIRGTKKTYRHYCPISDFKSIGIIVKRMLKENNEVSKPELLKELEKEKFYSRKLFSDVREGYKVNVTLYVLEQLDLITVIRPGRGRIPIIIRSKSLISEFESVIKQMLMK